MLKLFQFIIDRKHLKHLSSQNHQYVFRKERPSNFVTESWSPILAGLVETFALVLDMAKWQGLTEFFSLQTILFAASIPLLVLLSQLNLLSVCCRSYGRSLLS